MIAFSVRRIEYPQEDPHRRSFAALVNVFDLPLGLAGWHPFRPVQADPYDESFVTTIVLSLHDNPSRFHILNQGLTISASAVTFDNKTNRFEVTLTDPVLHGVLDGRHTLRAIEEFRRESLADKQTAPHVRLEVITGLTDPQEVRDVMQGRHVV